MIAIACDHGGFALKQELIAHLTDKGYALDDMGCYSTESVDYPTYAEKVACAVAAGTYEKGILICGTGIGMSIAANKIHGVRAALCADCYSAEMARQHNNSNVLCLGGRTIGSEVAKRIAEIWLSTPFSDVDKHVRRIGMIQDIEHVV
jgi:ribose 5-phosphate isomerase B